jgi:hypothetical protein
MPTDKPFRNQRSRFHNYSPPYGDKATYNRAEPSEGIAPRGGFPSRRNNRLIDFWDKREYAAIVLFEATHGIRAYEERPERLKLRNGPSWFFYVPHFWIQTDRGQVIVELSANGAPATARQEIVAELARAHYARQGTRYVEISNRTIGTKSRAADAHALLHYLSVQPSKHDAILASDALAVGPATVNEVEAASGVSHGRLLALVRQGKLVILGEGPIGQASILGRPGDQP